MLLFLHHLKLNDIRSVGFNSIGYDYPLLHYIIENQDNGITAEQIYAKSMSIIDTPFEQRFSNIVPDYKRHLKQIDLYMIRHFDNPARATSLKVLEFNMRMDSVEDLPFPVGTILNSDQIDTLIDYNDHDVDATESFYWETLDMIQFRDELSAKYDRDFTNFNDTKIGKQYFIMKLEENGVPCYEKVNGQRQPRQTVRESINLADVIFPYIKFERPEFQQLVKWFSRQTITETKGVFSSISESRLGELAPYVKMSERKKKLKNMNDYSLQGVTDYVNKIDPLAWVTFKDKPSGVDYFQHWREAETLNCTVDDFQFDFGTGGIHGSVDSQIVESDDYWIVEDWDVASYYPNLAIVNRLYPAHLGEQFCDIYEDVYHQRQQYAKGTTENAMLKLALNGVYGDSNNKYSPFFDSVYTMAVTINGQLLLCMLAEQLMKLPELTVAQINTDGVSIKYPHRHQAHVHAVCKWWEDLTKLTLESVEYDRMFIRDVNNYIGEYKNGKLKRKGTYEYDLDWHQNHSALVVPRAAEAALVRGESIRDFIENHLDIMDFMLRTKVPRSSRLVSVDYKGVEVQQQNVSRYHISTFGKDLVKIMPPLKDKTDERRFHVNKGWKVTICNNIADANHDDIDYEWYINEAEKLVKPLRGN